MVNNNNKVLLYSGGMDSWLIDKLWKPDVKLYINIGGAYSSEEIKRLPTDVKVVNFDLLGSFELDNKFVPLRNLYFLMLASHFGDNICLGATAGDWGNKDKTPYFLDESEKLIRYLYTDKKVKRDIHICKDFIYRAKTELLEEYLAKGGDIQTVKKETFSCYTPYKGRECLDCYPCFRKFAILYSFHYPYSEEEKNRMWEYIKRQIIPTKEEGGYPGTYYTDRGKESKYLIWTVEKLKEEFAR